MASSTLETLKTFIPIISGGVAGAVITYVLTSFRNRIQSIGTETSISLVELPKDIISSHTPTITLSGIDSSNTRTTFPSKQPHNYSNNIEKYWK